MQLEPWQWALVAAGAFLVGLSKTGLAGIGILFVSLFANTLPAKQATGFVLPLLIFGDLAAVTYYRRHANWRHLWRLFPWTAAGVILGWLALGRIDDGAARRLIGAILLSMAALHLWKKRPKPPAAPAEPEATSPTLAPTAPARASRSYAATTGILAGFTTLVSNAAGPVMNLYLLAMRLPKLEFLGTAAVFFLLLNLFKVPFMAGMGLITAESLRINFLLLPVVLAGAILGRRLVPRINQVWFERIALSLTVLAGLNLLLR